MLEPLDFDLEASRQSFDRRHQARAVRFAGSEKSEHPPMVGTTGSPPLRVRRSGGQPSRLGVAMIAAQVPKISGGP